MARVGSSPSAGAWGGVELLERALGYTRGCLMAVTADLLSAPTPCAQWDLRTLLEHMDDSLASLEEAGSARRVSVGVRSTAPEDLVGGLRQRACRLLAEWAHEEDRDRRDVLVDGRPLTSSVLASAGALEVAVHGWDVAAACGLGRPVPDLLAVDLLRVAPVLVTAADRPDRFAAEVPMARHATPGQRLLGFLGRPS